MSSCTTASRAAGGGSSTAPPKPAPSSEQQAATESAVSDTAATLAAAAATAAAGAPSAGTASNDEVASLARPRSQLAAARQQFAAALERSFEAFWRKAEQGHVPPTLRPPSGSKHGMKYRGVTRHKRTQRFEAHIWETKKQIYLGGFDSELMAARSHDIMALRCKGLGTDLLNFPLADYSSLAPLVGKLSREDVVTALRDYSKAQTIKRGIMPPKGGVRKVSGAPSGATAAGAAAAAADAEAAEQGGRAPMDTPPLEATPAGSPGRLSIVTRRRATRAASLEAAEREAQGNHPGSPSAGEQGESLPHHQAQQHPPAPFTPMASSLPPMRAEASRALRRRLAAAASPRSRPVCSPTPAARASLPRLLSGVSSSTQQAEAEDGLGRGLPAGLAACLGSSTQLAEAVVALAAHGRAAQHAQHAQQAAMPSPFSAAASGPLPLAPPAAGSYLDDLELDEVLATMETDKSLTLDASEEGRLFEWTPVDSAHSGLEHTLNGTVLICSPAQREEHMRAAEALSQDTSLSCVASTLDSLISAGPLWAPPYGLHLPPALHLPAQLPTPARTVPAPHPPTVPGGRHPSTHQTFYVGRPCDPGALGLLAAKPAPPQVGAAN